MTYEVAPYSHLLAMRAKLAATHRLDDYGLFSRSMLGAADADLMRRAADLDPSGDEAGEVYLDLFSFGGIGSLTASMTALLRRKKDDSDLLIYLGIVLAGQVEELEDGTALRALFEFAYQEHIRRNLIRVTEALSEAAIGALLQRSAREQTSNLLQRWGDAPSARNLWLLRTYVDFDIVAEYLTRFAESGSTSALASLFFRDDPVDWRLFDRLLIDEPYKRRIAVNLVIENVARGAQVAELDRVRSLDWLDDVSRAELEVGLLALSDASTVPDITEFKRDAHVSVLLEVVQPETETES